MKKILLLLILTSITLNLFSQKKISTTLGKTSIDELKEAGYYTINVEDFENFAIRTKSMGDFFNVINGEGMNFLNKPKKDNILKQGKVSMGNTTCKINYIKTKSNNPEETFEELCSHRDMLRNDEAGALEGSNPPEPPLTLYGYQIKARDVLITHLMSELKKHKEKELQAIDHEQKVLSNLTLDPWNK